MHDIFSFDRGKVLMDSSDLYSRFFSEARLKTTEHNIYERSKNTLVTKNEKTQKQAKTEEN